MSSELLRRELELTLAELTRYKQSLWCVAQGHGGKLHVSQRDLDLIPDNAELPSWSDPLHHTVIFQAITPREAK